MNVTSSPVARSAATSCVVGRCQAACRARHRVAAGAVTAAMVRGGPSPSRGWGGMVPRPWLQMRTSSIDGSQSRAVGAAAGLMRELTIELVGVWSSCTAACTRRCTLRLHARWGFSYGGVIGGAPGEPPKSINRLDQLYKELARFEEAMSRRGGTTAGHARVFRDDEMNSTPSTIAACHRHG